MPEYKTLIAGVLFIVLALVLLFGITLGQICLYYSYFKQDTKYVRITVVAILLLEFVHTAMCARMLYLYSIISRSKAEATAERIDWCIGVFSLVGNLVATISQGFFTHRIWVFASRSYKAISIPLVLIITRTGVGWCAGAMMFIHDTWSSFVGNRGAYIAVAFSIASATINDAVIAISQVYFLRRIRSGSRGADFVMHTIITYAVNTCVITMLVAMAALFSFFLDSNTIIFGGLLQLECKLYANALLASLNSRRSIRKNYEYARAAELYPHAFSSMWFADASSESRDNGEDAGEPLTGIDNNPAKGPPTVRVV